MNIEEVSLNDPEVWDMIGQGRTKGCFQIESHLGKTWCKKLKPQNIEELSDLISLIRPGVLRFVFDGKSMAQHYADRKSKIDEAKPIHPALYDILKSTQQVYLFQEQIMWTAKELAGFSDAEVNSLRKAIGKKNAKDLFELETKFVEGCVKTGKVNKEGAELIFDNVKSSSRYLFCKSHSISYAYLAYQTAYMKCHYPEEFFKNWLQQADEKIDPDMEKRQLIMAAKAEGITVKGPHISKLEEDFFWDEDCIRYGICNVKSVGKSHLESLATHLGKLDNPTWADILFKVLPNVNKTAVENLIMCGAFSGFGRSRTEMIHHFNCVNEFTDKELVKLAESNGDPIQIVEDFLAKGSKKNGGFIATEARVSKVESLLARLKNPGRSLSDAPSVYAKVEEKLLGYPISNSELDGCSDASHATSSCLVVSEGMTEQCTLAVIITKIREHKTKNGDIMCFLSAEDDSGELENIVVFPDTYSLIKEFLYERSTVLLSGQMKDRERGSFIVDNVFQI